MQPWTIEHDINGQGQVTHHALPQFTAQWSTGDDNIIPIDGLCWSSEGSEHSDDSIHIYGFAWGDLLPDQKSFDDLMEQAVRVIDGWIASRF